MVAAVVLVVLLLVPGVVDAYVEFCVLEVVAAGELVSGAAVPRSLLAVLDDVVLPDVLAVVDEVSVDVVGEVLEYVLELVDGEVDAAVLL